MVTLVLLLAPIVAVLFQVPAPAPQDHPAGVSDPLSDVEVIAHGGAQGHAPGNTLPAFALALEQGADTLEMDLQLTADGEIVVIHDGIVDRTTDGTGAVVDLTLAELRQFDAGYGFEDVDGGTPYRGQGVTIPTLTEVFETFPETPMIVELKTDAGEAII